MDLEGTRDVIELLAHILVEALQLTTTRAGRVLRLVMEIDARECGRQRDSPRLLLRRRCRPAR
jgi:hypothetical protein